MPDLILRCIYDIAEGAAKALIDLKKNAISREILDDFTKTNAKDMLF